MGLLVQLDLSVVKLVRMVILINCKTLKLNTLKVTLRFLP